MKSLKTTLAAAASGLMLLLAAPALAKTPAAPAGPAMWQVSDEDTTIYLFGTVHALPEGIEWYTGPVRSALEGSDMLVTEIPMGADADAKMQQYTLSAGLLPEGTTLRSLLDEQQLGKYDAAMTGLGLPVERFDQFEPWMAGLTLTLLPLLQQGYSPDAGVEKQLLAHAGADKELGALETIEFQIGIFDSMPMEDQIDFLIASADQIGGAKAMLDAMVAEWVAGDPDGLAEVMNEGLESDPDLADALLYKRNANWAEWIDTRLDTPGSVFIAVGAGHLAGDKSVQDLLEERGIESVRVQ
ncbi:TraB/GumN family protein [Parerythrobacter lacustris]|uniref:TraB/GumN family protein n=1 Tax=Parerythrobacter lacustris TaxID=2969984 RepID=A0ABT1XRL7_9SPHN|nr:TraB/GumN family protein [Parerythrobacter lacustris]MCR2833909.1 TraB/GumN family protein [Parerythrobacter lacustris]